MGTQPKLKEVLAYICAHGGYCLRHTFNRSGELVIQVRVQCSKGHLWNANPEKMLTGSWCPKCAATKPRLSLAIMQALAKTRGGKCLSENYRNTQTKMLWECAKGHQWKSTAQTIRKGAWCPHCKWNAQKNTIEDMRELAAGRGGKCLSKTYVNNATSLLWRCEKKHKWKAQPANITMGQWCPKCARIKSRLSIDEMQALALKRGGILVSKKYRGNSVKLKWQCKQGHTWWAQPNNVKSRSWCPECAGNKRYSLTELKVVAKEHGGRCLAKAYKNGRIPVEWQCAKGHVFKKDPAHVIGRGQWCRLCSKTKPHSIAEMRKLAKRWRGQCLSHLYVNNHTPLQWKCRNGHQFEKSPKHVLNRGQWCPKCPLSERRLNKM